MNDRAGGVESVEGSASGASRVRGILLGVVAVLVLAELAARVVGGSLPSREVFYDPVAQAKDAQLDRVDRDGGVDLVVTGPSSTLFGVDPDRLGRELGVDAYNAGISAGVPAITADWLQRYVLPRARPRTVVWVLSTVDFNDGVEVGAVESYFHSEAGRRDTLARLDRDVSKVSALVRHRRELRSPKAWVTAIRGRPDDVERWAARLSPNGLAEYEELPLNDVARQQLQQLTTPFRIDGDNATLIQATVARMQADGIRVVLAEAPLPSRSIALHPHGEADVRSFQRRLQAVGRRTGATVIALPADMRANALYQDYTHLNHEGAARYSDLLGARIGDAG